MASPAIAMDWPDIVDIVEEGALDAWLAYFYITCINMRDRGNECSPSIVLS